MQACPLRRGWDMASKDILRSDRRETIRQAAYSLAEGGSCADWHAIEHILCGRYGVIEVRRLFIDRAFCQNVNRRCVEARRKRDAPAA